MYTGHGRTLKDTCLLGCNKHKRQLKSYDNISIQMDADSPLTVLELMPRTLSTLSILFRLPECPGSEKLSNLDSKESFENL